MVNFDFTFMDDDYEINNWVEDDLDNRDQFDSKSISGQSAISIQTYVEDVTAQGCKDVFFTLPLKYVR